jgi:hypothetical protein
MLYNCSNPYLKIQLIIYKFIHVFKCKYIYFSFLFRILMSSVTDSAGHRRVVVEEAVVLEAAVVEVVEVVVVVVAESEMNPEANGTPSRHLLRH